MKRIILFISPVGLICAVPLKSNPTAVAGIFLIVAGLNWMGLWIDVYLEMQKGPPKKEDKPVEEAPPKKKVKEPAPPPPPPAPKPDDSAEKAKAELEKAMAERMAALDKLELAQKELAEQAEAIAKLQEHSEKEAKAAQAQLDKLQNDRQKMNENIGKTADELAAQVMITLSEAEQAITSAIEAFTNIAGEMEEAHKAIENALGGSEQGLVEITQQTSDVMNSYLQRLVHSSSDILEMSRQLQDFRKVANRLLEPLNTVESVTRQTMMIALAAAKAAAKDEGPNPSLQAIVDKVNALGESAHGAAEQMRTIMHELAETTDTIADSVATMGQSSLVAGAKAQQDIHHLIPLIQAAAGSTETTFKNFSEKHANIEKNYQQVLMALQFHDMLRQRLEHVAQPLCVLRDTLNFSEGATPEELAAKLEAAIESTRSVIPAAGAAPALDIVDYAAEQDGDVTLF